MKYFDAYEYGIVYNMRIHIRAVNAAARNPDGRKRGYG